MTERQKMLAGEMYDPLDPELVSARERARDLCQALNATRESQQEERRRLLRDLFGTGGESVWSATTRCLVPPCRFIRLCIRSMPNSGGAKSSASLSRSVPTSGLEVARSSCRASGLARAR